MKWKGRRESKNLEDGRGESVEVTIEDLINDDFVPDGPAGPSKRPNNETNKKVDEYIKKNKDWMYAAEEVAQRGDNVPTPTPRPKTIPDTKQNKSGLTQVTPGNWKTKNRI